MPRALGAPRAPVRALLRAARRSPPLTPRGRGGRRYSDLDIVLGRLVSFVERSELMEHHIVTYSFGDADALYRLGAMHRKGEGGPRDDDAALECWTRAAELGHSRARDRAASAYGAQTPEGAPPRLRACSRRQVATRHSLVLSRHSHSRLA